MYERFASNYPPCTTDPAQPYDAPALRPVEGLSELIAMGAGLTFGQGILRVHSESEAKRAKRLVAEMFPEFEQFTPIAKDWLGRQLGILAKNSQQSLLLVEPGSGEGYHIDCGLPELFNTEMVADPDTYLASDLFADWKQFHPEIPASGQCVGFKVPLFLGGSGSVDNLEISDEEVYWSIFGQLRGNLRS